MRFVIHIGTHKTGTSSLQNFFASNRGALRSHGIHYPLSHHSGRNVNFLPPRIASGRHGEVSRFLIRAARGAARRSADTVLLSAESFYAMTSFFRVLVGRAVDDYWRHERKCVARLAELLPSDNVTVICYLRRQDVFLESLYNQMVKEALGYGGSFDDFLGEAERVADYAGHLGIWRDVFGADALVVRRYDDAAEGLVDDFLGAVLGIHDSAGFRPPGRPVNPSLGMEALAFKRVVNRLPMPLAESYVSSRVIGQISREMKPDGTEKPLLDGTARRALYERHIAGNRVVAEHFLSPPSDCLFPSPEPSGGGPGDRLSLQRGLEILVRYRREMGRPTVRAEILLRRVARATFERVPLVDKSLRGIRRIANMYRIHRERVGR